jgi:hypothetical protein
MMTPGTRAILRVVVAGALLAGATVSLSALPSDDTAVQESASGTWTGTAQVNGRDVPFQLEISGTGDEVRGALVNGKERSAISSGSYSDGHLVLHFDYYANTLDATLRDGVLTGTFAGHTHSIPITAHLNGKLPAAAANPPHIAGVWMLPSTTVPRVSIPGSCAYGKPDPMSMRSSSASTATRAISTASGATAFLQ